MAAFFAHGRPVLDNRWKIQRRIPCAVSKVYDEEHLEKYGMKCNRGHEMFHWQGRKSNRVGLIGDSLTKWMKGIPHLEVQSLPGLTLSKALQKMKNGEIKTSGFRAILIFIATNDLRRNSVFKIAKMMQEIVTFLRTEHPQTRLGVSLIIPRPKDTKPWQEEKRRKVNACFKKMCRIHNLAFMNSYKGVCINDVFDETLYALDKIHLNRRGVANMKEYLAGVAAAMLA
jgi:hypothetical protein